MTAATDAHESLLRCAFQAAKRAVEQGNHPIGAVLVDDAGIILFESENGFMPERDRTAHAERLLATRASKAYEPGFLARCTLYGSAEPCAMCAGAIYWAGIGRMVFRTEREAVENDYGRPRRESDDGAAMSNRFRCRPALGERHRAAARR